MFCPKCGTELVEGALFCHKCGCRLADAIPERKAEARIELLPESGEPEPGLPVEEAVPEEQATSPTEPPQRHKPVIGIDESHKERTHTADYAELKARLRARGKVSVRTKKPLSPSFLHDKDMFVIGGPEHPWIFGRGADRWDEEEVSLIQGFVARGGALLLMGDSLASAERMSAVTTPFGIAFSGDLVGDVTVSGESIFPHPVTEGVEEIALGTLLGGGGNYLQVNEPAIVLARYEGRPVLAYREYEEGRVVVFSSLCALSNRYIDAKGNATLLENILNHLLIPRVVEKERPAAKETVARKAEPTQVPEPAAVSEKTAGRGWREALEDLIRVWDDWEKCWSQFSEACRETEYATFPRDRDVLIRAWQRDIRHWQPRFIQYAQEEIRLWDEIKKSGDLSGDVFGLIHALQINRSMALSHKKQHLSTLKKQLKAMREHDKQRVDSLLEQDLRRSKASGILGNDYSRLLSVLREGGFPIPRKHVPKMKKIRDDDYEVGRYVVQELVPIPMPGMTGTLDPWMSDYEEWMQARQKADAARDELERYSNTMDFYLETIRNVRQQMLD
jgi:hypothetical protein